MKIRSLNAKIWFAPRKPFSSSVSDTIHSNTIAIFSLLYSCNTHVFFYHPWLIDNYCAICSLDMLRIVQQLVHWCSFLFFSESFEWTDIKPTQGVILYRFDTSWRRELCGHARLAYGTKIIVSCTWTKANTKNLTWIGVKNKRLCIAGGWSYSNPVVAAQPHTPSTTYIEVSVDTTCITLELVPISNQMVESEDWKWMAESKETSILLVSR